MIKLIARICLDWLSWIDGKYITLEEYAITQTPEMQAAYYAQLDKDLEAVSKLDTDLTRPEGM
jgi:hypothetical protein